MPNTETVRALINAFNLYNYGRNTVKTNFKLQREGKKDYIVVSFEKSMDTYQCSEYLDSIKRKIIREFYGIEESNDAEILDTAKLIFDVNSFPFDISNRDWSWDKQHGFKFVTPVDEGVIFNLKSHLAASLAKDVIEGMPTCNIRASDRKGYLWRGEFDNKGLRKKFESEFLLRMRERYENVPKKPLEVKGNSVYIKDVFDDARFIDSVTRRVAWLVGIDLGVSNDVDHSVMLFKDSIINSFYQSTKTIVAGFMCASPLNREEASILIPIMQDCRGARFLTKEEARNINHAFNNVVLDDVSDKVQAEISADGGSGIYGIDFSNKEISHCVITKIMESSVINKDHELSIDPELVRALSPAQSPVKVPNGPSSSLTGSSSSKQESPTGSQSKELEGPPRRGFIGAHSGLVSVDQVDVPGMSREFPPSSQVNSIAVSCVVQGPSSSSQSVGAAANMPAWTSASFQPMDRWSLPAPGAGLWSLPQSRPSSWKGANKSGSAWTSTGNPDPLPPPPPLIPLPVSGGSVSGFRPPVSFTSTRGPGSSPPPLISSSGGIVPRFQPPAVKSPLLLTPSLPGTSGNERSASVRSTDSGHPESPWPLTNERSASVRSTDSGHPESPWPLTNERSASVRSTDSGHPESPWPLQFTSEGNIQPMDCLPSQGTLGEEELTINKWMQRKGANAGANKCRTEPTHETLSKEKEELVKALLYRFNSSNYYRGDVHTNFILENGKIVSKLNEIDKQKYLTKVRNCTINDCVTEEVAKGVYDFGQFPFVFPPDFQRDEEGKIIVAHNIDDAMPNLKFHLIQKFRIQVEEEAAKKLEKMGVTEACERIKESVYLAAKSRDSGVWYIFFDQKRFQRPDFEKFKSIYVEAFKSRWKKCGLDDSLVDYKNDALYIKDAIDINFVKKIEEYEKKEYEKLQASLCYPLEEISPICFPPEGIEGESPIALDGEGRYFLDHDFGSDCESMDCENTERNPLKRKSSSSEGSSSESSRSGSSNSSSEEEVCSPCSSFSDSGSEQLCKKLRGANLGRK